MINKLKDIVNFILETIVIISSVAIIFLTVFLVVSRYFFGWSIVGLLEIIMVFAIWLYMSGSLIASKNTRHLEVNILALKLENSKFSAVHQLYIAIAIWIISCFFIYWSYHMIAWGIKRPQSTPGLSIPLLLPQMAIMFAAIGSFLYAIRDIFRSLKNKKTEVSLDTNKSNINQKGN